MSSEKIAALIGDLDTSSDKTAEKVIKKLMDFKTAAVPHLLKAAQDGKNPRIRKWSLQALGAIGDKRAAPLLVAALEDERMTVRLHAIKGLGRMGYGKAAKKIASLLINDESGGIRLNALYVLMDFGDKSVQPQIKKALADPQWYVKQNACIACSRFRIRTARTQLKKMSLKDDRKAVRQAALAALEELEGI